MFKVRCIDTKDAYGRLSIGAVYEVLRSTYPDMYELRDNSGKTGEWLRSRFERQREPSTSPGRTKAGS